MADFLKEPSYPLSALNSLQQVILNKLIKEPLDLGTFNRPQDVLKIIPDKNIKEECDYLANFTKNFSACTRQNFSKQSFSSPPNYQREPSTTFISESMSNSSKFQAVLNHENYHNKVIVAIDKGLRKIYCSLQDHKNINQEMEDFMKTRFEKIKHLAKCLNFKLDYFDKRNDLENLSQSIYMEFLKYLYSDGYSRKNR